MSPFSHPVFRSSSRWPGYAGIGALAYLVTLLATLPAGLFLPHAQGTIWHGAARVDRMGALQWRWSPWRSLVEAGWAADWTLEALGGNALLQPSRLMLKDVRGQSDLTALAPLLPVPCEGKAQVNLDLLVLGGQHHAAIGRVTSGPARCKGITVPPLVLIADEHSITLAPQGQQGQILLGGTLGPTGRLQLRTTPIGSKLLPFLPATIESDL